MDRHVMSKHRNVFTEMSAVSLRASFCLHDCRNDRVRKIDLVSISIASSFRSNYPSPERIVWCYSQWQPAYTEMLVAMPHIEFVKGIPTALEQDSYFDVNKRNLIVFDDQMIDASKDKRIVNLFTRGSHHRNLSVIYIVQNLFHQGKGSRSISLNSHYLVLFKNPRDKSQILTLAKQVNPRQTDFFLNQYENVLKRPFCYLLIYVKTTTQDNCRQRTNVLPSEGSFNQVGFQENIPQELLKYQKQQNISPVPLLPAM